MSRFGILCKNYKSILRPNFRNVNLTSDFNCSLRRNSTNTSCIHNVIERNERENEVYYNNELNIFKKKNLEDFVNTVDKFQKAKLEDIQKVLVTAQRFQANQQGSTDSHFNLTFNLEDLNKVDLSRVDQIPMPKADSNISSPDGPTVPIVSKELEKNTKTKKTKDGLQTAENLDPMSNNMNIYTKKDYLEIIRKENLELEKSKFNNNLHCYIELCAVNGMLNRAFNFLTNYYLKELANPSESKYTKDVELYLILMNAFAKQGNQEALKKLYSQIIDMQMKPSMGIFAAIFECLGRAEKLHIGPTRFYLSEVQRYNLKMEDIFQERIYTPMEQKYVLKAISPMLPSLVVKPRVMSHDYDCKILNHLNDKSQFDNSIGSFMNKEKINKRLEKMLEMEVSGLIVVKSIIDEESKPASSAAREELNFHRNHWRQNLLNNFNSMVGFMELNGNQTNSGVSLFPFMKLFKPDEYVEIMMQEIDHMGEDLTGYSPPTHVLHEILGNKVYNKFQVQTKVKNLSSFLPVYKEYLDKISERDLPANHRTIWNTSMLSKLYHPIVLEKWPYQRRKDIGKLLYDIVMSSVKLKRPKNRDSDKDPFKWNIPGFYTKHDVQEKDEFVENVVVHPLMRSLFEKAGISEYKFPPYELPMLLPPVPWTNLDNGASPLNSVDLIRYAGMNKDMIDVLESHPVEKMYPMLDGLNVLGACPWRVNTWMLDNAIKLFKEGGDKHLEVPVRYPEKTKIEIHDQMTPDEIKSAKRHNKEVEKLKKEHFSVWITENYRLSIANMFRNVPMFWFSHNVDFRGRTYPTQPHFNHYGNDLGRSLLQFGIGKPLGPTGLDWLKIHLVNLSGFMKKQSNADKLVYADKYMNLILDSADNPFDGEKWWQTCDKPWQTLSSCKELADAMRSPDPEKFISHLPVHQDGSCNGLQHYAALGRDEKGAKSVNLAPSVIPQDVYSDVVDIIESKRKKDAAEGNEIAKQLENFVTRKVVKQTIMTTVYGVTKYGARQQIKSQLKNVNEFPKDFVQNGTTYLTNETFGSLKTLFHAAQRIQDWFALTAKLISKTRKVSWETPLGWPVIQPYVSVKKAKEDDKDKEGKSKDFEGKGGKSKDSEGKGKDGKDNSFVKKQIIPDNLKQTSAFAPNFVHSLDAAHMTLTAINCHRSGVLFNAVHDCFWTHAGDTDTMNRICREQFIALHGEPILEILSEHYIKTFGFTDAQIAGAANKKQKDFMLMTNEILRRVPEKGHFDLEQVKESTYFFS